MIDLKGAEKEFSDMSVIPRGVGESWGLYRKPISEKTVAENIRKWMLGHSEGRCKFTICVDESKKTPSSEREIAPHPSLKTSGIY